jgi:osmotically-inducible protein OsmY
MSKAKYLSVATTALIFSGVLSAYAADPIVYGSEDARITAEVRGAIAEHPDLRPPNLIYVMSRRRVVYLSGIVATPLSAANAEGVARQVPGVARVVSNISVDND